MSEQFCVSRDGESDIKFSGVLMSSVASSPDRSSGSSYSGSVGRWTMLKLYRTEAGKMICSRVENTQWQGERDSYAGAVCCNESEVCEFFGYGWLAKELYEDAGIDAAEVID